MEGTRRFRQKIDGRVYHNCAGPEVPCHLFSMFSESGDGRRPGI